MSQSEKWMQETNPLVTVLSYRDWYYVNSCSLSDTSQPLFLIQSILFQPPPVFVGLNKLHILSYEFEVCRRVSQISSIAIVCCAEELFCVRVTGNGFEIEQQQDSLEWARTASEIGNTTRRRRSN